MGKGGGGHGGLNILPQKSWNVYGWEQRERVQRDEEAAEAEEKAASAVVDQKKRDERREILLARAGGEGTKRLRDDSGAQLATGEGGHLNFFHEAEEGEKQYKAAKAAQGPLDETHRLGYGAGKEEDLPWYAAKGSSLYDKAPKNADSLPARVRREKEETLALRGSFRGGAAAPALLLAPAAPPAKGGGHSDSAAKSKSNEKQEKKERPKGKKSMEELRAERVAREEAERRRERAVLMAALPPSKGAPAGGDGGFGFGEGRGGKRYNSGYGHAPPKRGRTSY